MVVLQIGKLFYSNEICLEELVLYVHPDYRNAKGGRAHKLVEFSKARGKTGATVADRCVVLCENGAEVQNCTSVC